MTKVDFLRRLRQVSLAQRERFGYPFLPLGLLRQELGLESEEFRKLLAKCHSTGEIRMTPLVELVLHQLPAGTEVVTLEDGAFVSLALADT